MLNISTAVELLILFSYSVKKYNKGFPVACQVKDRRFALDEFKPRSILRNQSPSDLYILHCLKKAVNLDRALRLIFF
jgi:hypothetical protein